jgi:hypothetical protein
MLCAFFEVRTEGFALMNFSRPFAPPKDNYCSLDPIDFVFVLYWYRKGFSHN